jgi:lambda family phage tail tape measure protein
LRNAFLGITDGSAGGGRGNVNPAAVRPKIIVPDLDAIAKARREAEERAARELKQLQDNAKERSELRQKESAAIAEFGVNEQERRNKEVAAARGAVAAAQAEFDMTGKLRSEIAELTLQRLEDKLAAFSAGSANAIAVQQEIEAQKELIAILQRGERRDKQARNDPLAGANRAVQDYLKEIEEAGLATERVVGNALRSLEDSLVTLVSKGKLDVRSLIDTMIAEFLRLNVIRPLLQNLLGGSGGLGALFGFLLPSGVSSGFTGYGGRYADGGAVSGGKTYLVGERGPELLTMGAGGYITPNDKIGGKSVTVEYKPNIVIDSRTDRNEVRQLIASSVQQGNRQLIELMKARGVFA